MADIKRLNGLATDLQMFALKTLHIPLPGRHPPSPSLSDGSSSSGYIYSTLMSLFFVLAYFFGEMDHVGILAIIVDILSHALKLSFKDCLNIDFLVFITSCYEISQVIHVLYVNASRIT